MIPLTTCPLTGSECRHCSNETITKIGTKVGKNKTTGLYEATGRFKETTSLGLICNNAPLKKEKWIAKMKACPIRKEGLPAVIDLSEPTIGLDKNAEWKENFTAPTKKYVQVKLG